MRVAAEQQQARRSWRHQRARVRAGARGAAPRLVERRHPVPQPHGLQLLRLYLVDLQRGLVVVWAAIRRAGEREDALRRWLQGEKTARLSPLSLSLSLSLFRWNSPARPPRPRISAPGPAAAAGCRRSRRSCPVSVRLFSAATACGAAVSTACRTQAGGQRRPLTSSECGRVYRRPRPARGRRRGAGRHAAASGAAEQLRRRRRTTERPCPQRARL